MDEKWAIGLDTDDEFAQIITESGEHILTVERYPHIEIAKSIISQHNALAGLNPDGVREKVIDERLTRESALLRVVDAARVVVADTKPGGVGIPGVKTTEDLRDALDALDSVGD